MLDILLYDGFDHHAAGAEHYASELEAAARAEAPPKHLVQFAKVAVHRGRFDPAAPWQHWMQQEAAAR